MRDDCDHSWSQYAFCVKCVFCVKCGRRCPHEKTFFYPDYGDLLCMSCGTIITPHRLPSPKEWSPKPEIVRQILRVLDEKGQMTPYKLNQELSKKRWRDIIDEDLKKRGLNKTERESWFKNGWYRRPAFKHGRFVGWKAYNPRVLSSKSQLYKYLDYAQQKGLVRVVELKPWKSNYGNRIRRFGVTEVGKKWAGL